MLRASHRMLEIESCIWHSPPTTPSCTGRKLRPRRGLGWPRVCSPLPCHMRTSQGQQHSLLWSEAARWRSSDAPWWNLLLERPGHFPLSPETALPGGPPSEGTPVSGGHPPRGPPPPPGPPSGPLALLSEESSSPPLCHTCPGGEADMAFCLGPQFVFGAPWWWFLPPPFRPLVQGGVRVGVPRSRPPASPVAGLGAVAVAGDPSGQPGCVVRLGVLSRPCLPRWCTTSLPS